MVHLYTASGSVFALLSVIAIEQKAWAEAMGWLVVCFFIDGSDGLLARKWKVRENLPSINGKNIDFVIDFLTYAFIPAYFLYHAGMVRDIMSLPVAAYILLISAIYYGKQGMVTEQRNFRGFPVLWNLVVFYGFFVFNSGPVFNEIMVLGFGILHFVPIEVSYPSQHLQDNLLPFVVGIASLGILGSILWVFPARNPLLIAAAYGSLVYFTYLTIRYTWFKQT